MPATALWTMNCERTRRSSTEVAVATQATTDEVAMNDTCPREQVAEDGEEEEGDARGKLNVLSWLSECVCVAHNKSISLPEEGNKNGNCCLQGGKREWTVVI